MMTKEYWIADAVEGGFDGPFTEEEATESLEYWIANGITKEKAIQDVTGLSDEEIEKGVRGFYSIAEKDQGRATIGIMGDAGPKISDHSHYWYDRARVLLRSR
jgi:hypothetical protein